MKAGDRIVKIASRDISNVYDYTYALGEMKAGEEYGSKYARRRAGVAEDEARGAKVKRKK